MIGPLIAGQRAVGDQRRGCVHHQAPGGHGVKDHRRAPVGERRRPYGPFYNVGGGCTERRGLYPLLPAQAYPCSYQMSGVRTWRGSLLSKEVARA